MEGSGGGGDAAAEGAGAGFEWDADSRLYYHARFTACALPFRFSPHAPVFRRLGVADGRCFEGRGACDFKRPGVVGVVGCAHGAS